MTYIPFLFLKTLYKKPCDYACEKKEHITDLPKILMYIKYR